MNVCDAWMLCHYSGCNHYICVPVGVVCSSNPSLYPCIFLITSLWPLHCGSWPRLLNNIKHVQSIHTTMLTLRVGKKRKSGNPKAQHCAQKATAQYIFCGFTGGSLSKAWLYYTDIWNMNAWSSTLMHCSSRDSSILSLEMPKDFYSWRNAWIEYSRSCIWISTILCREPACLAGRWLSCLPWYSLSLLVSVNKRH